MSTDLQWLPARVEVYPSPARCKFLTAESFLSVALQAYLSASKDLVPPRGEPWALEGATWANAQGFYDALIHEVQHRLRLAALGAGDLFERFAIEPSGCRGETPAEMAHGCAALLSAAGAAPGLAQGPVHQHVDQLFSGPERQELPQRESVVNVSANRGKGS